MGSPSAGALRPLVTMTAAAADAAAQLLGEQHQVADRLEGAAADLRRMLDDAERRGRITAAVARYAGRSST